MAGDFTSVPLRTGARWTAARLQQGRVLLDTDWNLTVDAAAALTRDLAREAIGPAGVHAGSSAFQVSFAADGSLHVGAGSMWVDGLLAVNPADLDVAAQPEIPPLPSGTCAVYLDATVEDVQGAENPDELLDPALGGIDTTVRQRVGWRVRTAATAVTSCAGAAAALPAGSSTGTLDVVRTTPPAPTDPCAPPDDPRVRLPDGLLRIEVLDSGTESSARFGWSFDNGSSIVAATVAGTSVTCAPSPSVAFAPGDLVEVSTLARRADRRDCGALLPVAAVTAGAGGAVVTLASASPVTGDPPGTALRRWDGESVGAAAPTALTMHGSDVGVAFSARPGSYLAGDWWGVRLRGSASDAVETRSGASPDGGRHSSVLLAVVDTAAKSVLSDCRPTYTPLTGLDVGGSTCTVTAAPGEDLLAAVDRLPATGGQLCLAAGTYTVSSPLLVRGRSRVVVSGVGAATVLRVTGHETVLRAESCTGIEVRDVRVEAGQPAASPPGDPGLLGALTFAGCTGVVVRGCEVRVPDSAGRAQSGITVLPLGQTGSDDARILANTLDVGDQQVGILVTSTPTVVVADNRVRLAPAPATARTLGPVATELARFVAAHLTLSAAPPAPPPAPAPGVAAAPGAAAARNGTVLSLPGVASAVVRGGTPVQRVATDWAGRVTAAEIAAAKGPRAALEKFVRRAVLDPTLPQASTASLGFLKAGISSARSIGQGIVVGGSTADHVEVTGNLVDRAIQGVHVGLGVARTAADAGRVRITGNTVHNLVPFFWQRARHGYYVGSFASLAVTDNVATLAYTGTSLILSAVAPKSGMEAVRIWGRVGRYLQVRGLDASGGYRTAVTVAHTAPGAPPAGLHAVTDVLNLAGGGPTVAAPPWVTTERVVP